MIVSDDEANRHARSNRIKLRCVKLGERAWPDDQIIKRDEPARRRDHKRVSADRACGAPRSFGPDLRMCVDVDLDGRRSAGALGPATSARRRVPVARADGRFSSALFAISAEDRQSPAGERTNGVVAPLPLLELQAAAMAAVANTTTSSRMEGIDPTLLCQRWNNRSATGHASG
jgi:hypothetical protein